jgi:hypothetical protein
VVTKTSVWDGMLSGVSCFPVMCVWLCAWATTDGKSGSSTVVLLKIVESLWLQK